MKVVHKNLGLLSLSMATLTGGLAQAQSYLSPGYIIGEIRDGLGIIQQPVAPDFVVRGRPDPATLEYAPLKPPPRDLHSKANTPDKKLEAEGKAVAELEAARAKSAARATGLSSVRASRPSALSQEEGPAPMKWNAWDTE